MLMSKLYFMVNFVNTRKNYPDAKKFPVGNADEVFGTLVSTPNPPPHHPLTSCIQLTRALPQS